jgi:hypothetical protein
VTWPLAVLAENTGTQCNGIRDGSAVVTDALLHGNELGLDRADGQGRIFGLQDGDDGTVLSWQPSKDRCDDDVLTDGLVGRPELDLQRHGSADVVIYDLTVLKA